MDKNNKENNPKNNQAFKDGKYSFGPFLVMFTKMSGWIVSPVLVAIFLGRWLDGKYGTEPWLFLLCVGVAFLISTSGLIINASKIYRDIDMKK